jgi:hypothetical protein
MICKLHSNVGAIHELPLRFFFLLYAPNAIAIHRLFLISFQMTIPITHEIIAANNTNKIPPTISRGAIALNTQT